MPGFRRRSGRGRSPCSRSRWRGSSTRGCPLMRTLPILIEQTEDKKLQHRARAGARRRGVRLSLSARSREHPRGLPAADRQHREGRGDRRVPRAVARVDRGDLQDEAELRDKIRSATTYPVIVLTIAILGVLGMVTFIVPIFEGMFRDMGSALPLPTQVLVTANNMSGSCPCSPGSRSRPRSGGCATRTQSACARVIDPVKLKLPVFGSLATKIAVARFSRSLAMMLDAGVPLLQALSIVGEASNNRVVARAVARHPGVGAAGALVRRAAREGGGLPADGRADGVRRRGVRHARRDAREHRRPVRGGGGDRDRAAPPRSSRSSSS